MFFWYTNTLEREWRHTILAGYKYTWAWVKKYNLRWSGRRESGREWRASGRSATRGQTPALHSHHIVIITVLSSNCNNDSFLNHNGVVVISYSSRFFSLYCNHDSFCRIQVRSLPCLVSHSITSLVETWLMWSWRVKMREKPLTIFWGEGVFVVTKACSNSKIDTQSRPHWKSPHAKPVAEVARS